MTAHARHVRLTGGTRSVQVRPPAPGYAQHVCPVCRNTIAVTTQGYLRRHKDLYGHPCYNRAPGSRPP